MYVCVQERVCVREIKRERECVWEIEKECVCVREVGRERESETVCVCAAPLTPHSGLEFVLRDPPKLLVRPLQGYLAHKNPSHP